ncbi:2'-5' RNA ligase family protein [Echinicola salinicaeni]|uniref:2'-5' RNA ligase family protein n=1 Tax=Echinicola salinicaeni TaxID=2762757 RepID=UPI00164479EF|nr:mutarotase [Echinicola salinicaeni]
MNLDAHYFSLAQSSLEIILNDQYEIDPHTDNIKDSRRGLTLLARPDNGAKTKIQGFISMLRDTEPEQYYYPNADLHITILSIISCYPEFSINNISITDYVKIIKKSISEIPPFQIQYKGTVLSPAGVLIKGYPEGNSLQNLRNQLRKNFKNSPLEQSLDKRYTLQTAHSTIMRFAKPLQQKARLIQLVNEFNKHDFGSFIVKDIEFVYNDWYQKSINTKKLGEFCL